MNKNIECYIKIQIPSQEANPSPPIGPILGQKGINIIEFCKEFNSKTSNIEKGLLLSVIINISNDKSFSITIKSTPTSILLKKEINIKSGSKNPGKDIIYKITKDKIRLISCIKSLDMNTDNLEAIDKCIIGTAKSMGIEII